MNIGIAVHRFDTSEGTGRYAVELADRLAATHRVTVYAAHATADLPERVRLVRVPAVRATAYTFILSYPVGFAAVRQRHDLLHAQGWVTGAADIVTAHIVLAAWRDAARRAGVRAPAGERLLGGFVTRRERALMRRARAVIAPSRKAARDLASAYGREDGVHVIPHGFPDPAPVPAAAEARRALGLPGFPFIALFVGDVRKGLDVTLRALARTTQVHLAVVSHTPADRIRRLAADAGVADRVVALGAVPDIRTACAAADVLVHPTIYDTFGLAVADAMACGLPPIVTEAAGITERIDHGRSGWVLRGDRVAGLSDALRALAADAALRGRLADGARTAARRRTWDDVTRETVTLYEQVLAR